jgi:hypothetical protein
MVAVRHCYYVGMGLDAVVYRNKKNLELGPDAELAKLDPQTGEVYFEDNERSRKHRGETKAIAHRIGNIAAVGALREETSMLIGPESFIITKILYNGVHCGDVISLRDVPTLSAEVSRLVAVAKKSPELEDFISKLQSLIRAAESEGNPIVF